MTMITLKAREEVGESQGEGEMVIVQKRWRGWEGLSNGLEGRAGGG